MIRQPDNSNPAPVVLRSDLRHHETKPCRSFWERLGRSLSYDLALKAGVTCAMVTLMLRGVTV